MKMKQLEVVNMVKEFAKNAGYILVTVENLQSDETSKNWVVEISGRTNVNADVKKILVVNDETGEVTFQPTAK